MTYNITLTANHQSLTAEYLPIAAESVQYLTAKVVCETEDWTGREIKALFGQGCTVYEIPVTGGEITAKQQLNLTAGDWCVWLVGNSARDGEVIPRITTNVAHISVAPTGGTEGNPFPAIPPTVEEQLRADMGNLADLTTEDKSSLVAAINEAAESGGSKDAVTYTPQTLTDEQQKQARANIGAGQPVFAVNVTEVSGSGGYTADKTAAEIEAAYQAGRTIVCKTQARFLIGYMPIELPLVSRNQERVFIFAVDQLMGQNAIFTITVNISDSGVEVSTQMMEIYEKPVGGIPKSDLADDVQTSLGKADTAISLGLTSATPGQIIKVKAVQDGKPTEWEAVDMPSGGELILEYVHDESKFPPGRPAIYPIAYDADTKIWTSDGRLDLTTIAAAGETVSGWYQINIIEPLLQLSQDFDPKKWNPIKTFKLKVLSSNTFSTSDYVPPVIADDWSKYIMIANETVSINMPSNASDKIRMVFDGQFAGATRYTTLGMTEWFDPNASTTIANEIGYQQRRGIYNHIVCDFDLGNGKIYGTTSQTFVSYDKIGSAQGVYYPINAVAWPQIVLSKFASAGYNAMPYKGRLRIYNRG